MATTNARPKTAAAADAGRRLLVVEPDPLLRWSVTTYLGRWFTVEAVESAVEAEAVLRRQRVEAVLLSDVLPAVAADVLERAARNGNPRAVVVHMGTEVLARGGAGSAGSYIEKPFKLATLARLLGVESPERE